MIQDYSGFDFGGGGFGGGDRTTLLASFNNGGSGMFMPTGGNSNPWNTLITPASLGRLWEQLRESAQLSASTPGGSVYGVPITFRPPAMLSGGILNMGLGSGYNPLDPGYSGGAGPTVITPDTMPGGNLS